MSSRADEERRDFTREIIGAALDVHRQLGPGLLETANCACLVHELRRRELRVAVEVPVPVTYRGLRIDCAYRLDLMVEDTLPVELKSVRALEPIHTAQLLTYLKHCRKPLGLLINFNVPLLRQGIRRILNPRSLP